jgi:hypothetical protein
MAMVLAKLDRARFHAHEFDAKWNWYYHSGAQGHGKVVN